MKKLIIVSLTALLTSACAAEYPYDRAPDGRQHNHRAEEWRRDNDRRDDDRRYERDRYEDRYDRRYYYGPGRYDYNTR